MSTYQESNIVMKEHALKKMSFSPLFPLLDRVDAVFADLDGTLLHNEGTALDKIGQEIDKHIHASRSPRIDPKYKQGIGNIRHLAGTPLASIREIAARKVGIEIPETVERAILNRRSVEPEVGEIVNRIEGIVQALEYFKDNGIPTMIVTSSERDRATRYIRAAALEVTTLPHGLISGHSDFSPPKHKPHPDAYVSALEKCTAHPTHTLTFEDTVRGGEASVAAGIPTIGVLLGDHIAEDKKEKLAEDMIGAGFGGIIAEPSDIIPVLHKVLSSMPEHRAHNRRNVSDFESNYRRLVFDSLKRPSPDN